MTKTIVAYVALKPVYCTGFLKKDARFSNSKNISDLLSEINRFKGNIGNHFVDNFEKLFRLYA